MTKELKSSDIEVALGLGLFSLGFGVALPITSFSKVSFCHVFYGNVMPRQEVGRRPVYIFSSVTYPLTHVMVALSVCKYPRILRA